LFRDKISQENVLWNKLLAEESFTDAADDVFSKAATRQSGCLSMIFSAKEKGMCPPRICLLSF